MASNLIDQPTVGSAPRMSQGPATPIISAGSGSTGMVNPTFSTRGTSSPFAVAGPVLGGLVGAMLANRGTANAAAATRTGTAGAGANAGSAAANAAAAKAAAAIKAAALAKATNPTHPDGADSQGNIWQNGEVVKIPSAGLTKFAGKWYDVNGNLVDYSITGQDPLDVNTYDDQGNLVDPNNDLSMSGELKYPFQPDPLEATNALTTPPAPSGLGFLSGINTSPPTTPLSIRLPQAPSSASPAIPTDPLAGITATPPDNPLGDQMVADVMPDYNTGIYQDAAGNIWSNGQLVYDGGTGDYFSNNNWYNTKGDPYSLDNGQDYNFDIPQAPIDSGYSDTSFGAGDYNFTLPADSSPIDTSYSDWTTPSFDAGTYDFSTPSYSDWTMPSFDTGSYDFGFKDGGNVTMMKKGGLSQFAAGGPIHPTMSGGWADAQGNPTDSSGNPYDPNTGTFALSPSQPAYSATDNSIPAASYGAPASSSILDSLSNYLPAGIMDYFNAASNNLGGTALGAGAGAAIGSLLSGMTKGSGGVNQGVDMSQVGQIAPHTTNFGMGPARYVGYEDYGTQSGPDIYADSNLYENLGTPKKKPSGLESLKKADGGAVHFTYGTPVDPMQIMQGDQGMQGMRDGGTPEALGHPEVAGRMDFRQGSYVSGPGDGQSDDIPAMLADGEYVFDADTVAALGNGSSKAGSKALDKMREAIRAHKRSAPINKIPPPAKSPLAYLKGMK